MLFASQDTSRIMDQVVQSFNLNVICRNIKGWCQGIGRCAASENGPIRIRDEVLDYQAALPVPSEGVLSA
jgi:hypothetical protein